MRTGGAADVRQALMAGRARMLSLAEDFQRALEGRAMRVDYDAGLNPPVWEWGHIAWFQEWWVSRNRGSAVGSR